MIARALRQTLGAIAVLTLALTGCNANAQGNPVDTASFVPLPDGTLAGWRSDGTQLMLGYTEQGLSIIAIAGNTISTVESPLNYPQRRTFCPAWSPAGTALFYQERLTNTTTRLHLLNLSGTDTVFTATLFSRECPTWLPDGEHFSINTQFVNAPTVVIVFDQQGSYQRNLIIDNTGIDNVAWSPDGQYIAFDSWHSRDVKLADANTGEIITMGSPLRGGWHPTWAPNSKYIAYIEQGGSPPGIGDLIVAKIDGTRVITLAGPSLSADYYYTEPLWSPRGDYIAVERIHRNNLHDYIVAPREVGLIPVPDDLKRSATE